MIRLNLAELLERRGKTRYWLSRQMGISYQNVCRMVGQQTHGIRFELPSAGMHAQRPVCD